MRLLKLPLSALLLFLGRSSTKPLAAAPTPDTAIAAAADDVELESDSLELDTLNEADRSAATDATPPDEVCGNGFDDDGDETTDCEEEGCAVLCERSDRRNVERRAQSAPTSSPMTRRHRSFVSSPSQRSPVRSRNPTKASARQSVGQ